jgi:hypothetical protein
MILIILLIIIILFGLLIWNLINEETFENTLDLNNIKTLTKKISINRPVCSENLKKVKKIVMDEFKKITYLTYEEQHFSRNIKGKKYDFSNIIASNKKINDNYIILGCHIDGPQIDLIESATDAATCIAIIIEITKKILEKKPDYPIMIVFFDGEEAINGTWSYDNTLSGSNYFVENFNKKIKFLMVFDLIGADINKNKIYHFSTGGYKNAYYMKELANINNSLNYKYNKQIFIDPDIETSNIGILNDYTPFDKKYKNLNGLNIIPAKFPDNHHTIDDNYNNVNWEYIEIFTNVIYDFLLSYQ